MVSKMRQIPKVTISALDTIRAGAQPYQKVTTRKSDRKTAQIDAKVKNSRVFRDWRNNAKKSRNRKLEKNFEKI